MSATAWLPAFATSEALMTSRESAERRHAAALNRDARGGPVSRFGVSPPPEVPTSGHGPLRSREAVGGAALAVSRERAVGMAAGLGCYLCGVLTVICNL